MSATTDFRDTEFAGPIPAKGTLEQAADTLIYGGTIVTIDDDGRADVVTAGQHAAGVALQDYDNRTTAPEGGGAGAIDVQVLFGIFGLEYTGTAPEPGQVVYVVDNQTVSIDSSSGTRGVAGYCVEQRHGLCYTFMSPVVAGEISKLLSTSTGEGASLIGVEDSAANFAATNVEAALAEIMSLHASTSNGEGASLVGIEDAGGFTSAADVEAAFAELYQDLLSTKCTKDIPCGGNWHETDGTALAAFSDGASSTPGLALDNSEAAGIRWNNHASPDPVCTVVPVPYDLDESEDVTLTVVASKSGATAGDATRFTVEVFNNVTGALHDADADFGGDTAAMTGDAAAKTVQAVDLTLDAADLPDPDSAAACMTITLQPKDGDIGTDDVTVHFVRLTYTRKLRTA
jgi:hypothetical protein